jgi:BirA family biotin operon repressor/biotin-[acetyl-CoA-carboxylase] ligase
MPLILVNFLKINRNLRNLFKHKLKKIPMKFNKEKAEHLFFEKVDSTNDYLQRMIKDKKLPEGTVVWTSFQTHGKGHDKNTWDSEKGKNLLMSMLLRPGSLRASDQFQISRVISLALVDVIEKYCRQVAIKWPNDILVGKRKIAGILVENTILDNKIRESIAGIGLNVNQVSFPVYVPSPTSLKTEAGCHFDIPGILKELVGYIERWYEQLIKKDFQMLERAYENALFGHNETLDFEQKGRVFSARMAGTGPEGQLKLEMPGGEIREFGFKEVLYRL